jgi:hypothetical protein
MSIVSAMRGRMNGPVNLAAPRNPVSGKFAPASDPCAITPVAVPGGMLGYRVGPTGLIFADRDAAERFADNRRAKLANHATEPTVRFPVVPDPITTTRLAVERDRILWTEQSECDELGIPASRMDELADEAMGLDLMSRGISGV